MLSHRQTKGGHGQLGAEGLGQGTHTLSSSLWQGHTAPRANGSALRATGASSGAEMVTQAGSQPALPPTMSPDMFPLSLPNSHHMFPGAPATLHHFLPAALCKGWILPAHLSQILGRWVLTCPLSLPSSGE